MTKIILSMVAVSILFYCIYQGYEIYQYAKGVQEDTPKFVDSYLNNTVRNGDIIFQTSKSNQSKAIQLATNSKYSHMGIIYKIDNQLYVFEAIEPVSLTPLTRWINRGEHKKYVIKRLKNSNEILTPEVLSKMKLIGEQYKGKHYDLYFEWSDHKIYCSELVWKIYKKGAGIEIGKLEKLSSFDFSSNEVKQKMKERYGDRIPIDEIVVTPVAMYNSDKLQTIISH